MKHRIHHGLRNGAIGITALLLPTPSALAQDARPSDPAAAASPVGDYVHSQMELVAGIRLNEDGTFLYGLTVGSLDERGKGRWQADGKRIKLTSDPRPVAPTITAGRTEIAPGKPFAIRVVAPNGRDVPGVDFRIEFDSGEPLESYLPGEPWSIPDDERRVPRFVTFRMSSYRVLSERMPLDPKPGKVATFTLTPNDFGVVDLSDAHAEIDGDTLTLRRAEGVMAFKRTKREAP